MTAPRVLVTRQPDQAAGLVEGLAALGVTVLEVPLIEIAPPLDTGPLDAALAALHEYAWVAFTSANAVHAAFDHLRALGRAWPGSARIASVGPATTTALAQRLPDAAAPLEPQTDHRAEGLLRALAAHPLEGCRVLVPASDRARDVLARGLRERGAEVDVVTAYRNVPAADGPLRLSLALAAGIDLVTFASPSAVEAFVAAVPGRDSWPPAALIGPVTEEAARQAGFAVVAVADPSTAAGLVAGVRDWMARRPGTGAG